MAFPLTLPFSKRSRTRLLAVAAAALVAEALWLGAALVFGVHLQAPAGTIAADPMTLGLLPVALASLALSLLGWIVLAGLERLTPRARGIWLVLGLLGLAASLSGPLSGTGVTTANRVVLALMHLAVGAIVLTVLYRTSPGRVPPGVARLPRLAKSSHAAHRPPVHTDPTLSTPPLTFGTLYPQDDIVAVIDDLGQAHQAEAALHAAGIPADESDVLTAALVMEGLHDMERRRGWAGRLAAGVGSLVSDDAAHMRTYRDEAQRGHALVVVHAPRLAVVEQVRQVLRTHGAHGMRHYGSLAVTELD